MFFFEFKNLISPLGVFSLPDILKFYPDFGSRRLFEWQQKGYILKIRNGWYCFSDFEKRENFIFFVANRIYNPTYISLESALSYHNIIPEAVFSVCSVTTNKTIVFQTPFGEIKYYSVSPKLFFGYELIENEGKTIKMAYPEKAILDFFYIRKDYNSQNEMIDLRFTLDNISKDKLLNLLAEFKNITLEKRIFTLLKAYAII